MEIKTNLSSSVKFPELKAREKCLITEPDDKGFAQEQVDKLFQRLYLLRQKKLKPWEKDSYNNIYQSFGKTNHQILQNLRTKFSSYKTLNEEELSKSNYYKDCQLKAISNSQEISKQIQSNYYVRTKFKQPLTNLKAYTIHTNKIRKKKMISDILKNERDIMKKRLNEYEKSLKNEVVILDKDILNFEQFTTNDLLKKNIKFNYINKIQSNIKNLKETIKKLIKENNLLIIEIPRTLKLINDIKIYANFVHKLFGEEPELVNYNFDDINFLNMNEEKMHLVTNMLENEMKKSKNQDNILTNSDEELFGNIDKINLVFNFMEEKILKTFAKKEELRNEIESIIEEGENEKKVMKKKIQEREKEYQDILTEYEDLKENLQIISYSRNEYDEFVRKLHIELFESVKDITIKNKSDINEYNIMDKIIKPTLKDIKDKERKLDSLEIEMEKCKKKDLDLFNSLTKIKKENKIINFHQEIYNRENANTLKISNILKKMDKIMVTGKYKYKMQIHMNKINKKKNNTKTIKDENNDLQLLYY